MLAALISCLMLQVRLLFAQQSGTTASLSLISCSKGLQLSCSTLYQSQWHSMQLVGHNPCRLTSCMSGTAGLHCFDCMCCLQVVVQAAQVPKYEEPETLYLHKKPREQQAATSNDNGKQKRASIASRSKRQQDAAALYGQLFHAEPYKV